MIDTVLVPVLAFLAGAILAAFALAAVAFRAMVARHEMHQALCAVIHQNKLLRGEIIAEAPTVAPDAPVIWPEEIEL